VSSAAASALRGASFCAVARAGAGADQRARALAASKGITFRVARFPRASSRRTNLGLYRGAVRVVTPENDLKAWRVRPSADRYDYSGADRVVDFAASSKIGVHAHADLGNGKYNPPWIRDCRTTRWRSSSTSSSRRWSGAIRGRIVSWDVVNEPTSLGKATSPPIRKGRSSMRSARAMWDAASRLRAPPTQGHPGAQRGANRARTTRWGLAWRKNLLTCLDGLVESGAPDPGSRPAIASAAFNPLQPGRVRHFPHRDRNAAISTSTSPSSMSMTHLFPTTSRNATSASPRPTPIPVHRAAASPRQAHRDLGNGRPLQLLRRARPAEGSGAMRLPRPLLLDEKLARKPAWFAVERALREAPARS